MNDFRLILVFPVFPSDLPENRKANISYPLIHTRTCAYQGVTNIGFADVFRGIKREHWGEKG